jgi:hypothetical protein
MKTLKVTRANFWNTCSFYMVNYIISLLKVRYNVVVTNENPDIVFFSNHTTFKDKIDLFTNDLGKTEDDFPNAIKIYLDSEYCRDFYFYINKSELHYAIGRSDDNFSHNRFLNMPFFLVSSAWQLYDECKLFDKPFEWMIQKRDIESILKNKNKFVTVVQTSTNPYRREIFEKLNTYKKVLSCGGFETNDEECFKVAKSQTEKEDYKNKIIFQSESKFSLQIQSTCAPYFSQEKIIQGFASNTIPIFWGNPKILEDGYNPYAFINCHDFNSIDEVVDKVIEIDSDDTKYRKFLSEPIFVDNKLPEYYQDDYIFSFIDNILKKHNI